MNVLGLVNAYFKESETNDTVSALGDSSNDDTLRAMHWISEFWKQWQTSRKWLFRFDEKTISVVNGTTQYTADNLGLAEGDIIIRDSFYNASGAIEHLAYNELRAKRRASTSPDTTRVLAVAVRPTDGATLGPFLETYPDVDTTQVVAYDIWQGAQELTVQADTPYGLPSDFHMLIVHGALAAQAAADGGEHGANQYSYHVGKFKAVESNYLDTLDDVPVIEDTLPLLAI